MIHFRTRRVGMNPQKCIVASWNRLVQYIHFRVGRRNRMNSVVMSVTTLFPDSHCRNKSRRTRSGCG